MPIDKFGRSQISISGNKTKLFRGPKGEGFNLTTDGNFDINGKKLCNVSNPTDPNDAVTLNYLQQVISDFVNEIKNKFSTALQNSQKLSDAINVTKNYISLQGKRRIVRVDSGKDTNDVIIKKDFDNEIKNIKINVLDLKHQFDKETKEINIQIEDIKINLLDLKRTLDKYYGEVNSALLTLTENALHKQGRASIE